MHLSQSICYLKMVGRHTVKRGESLGLGDTSKTQRITLTLRFQVHVKVILLYACIGTMEPVQQIVMVHGPLACR